MKVLLHGYRNGVELLDNKPVRTRLLDGSRDDIDLGIKEFGEEMERDIPGSLCELVIKEA